MWLCSLAFPKFETQTVVKLKKTKTRPGIIFINQHHGPVSTAIVKDSIYREEESQSWKEVRDGFQAGEDSSTSEPEQTWQMTVSSPGSFALGSRLES